MIHPGVRTPLPRSSIRKRAKSKRPEGGWVQAPFGLLVFKNLSQHVNTQGAITPGRGSTSSVQALLLLREGDRTQEHRTLKPADYRRDDATARMKA